MKQITLFVIALFFHFSMFAQENSRVTSQEPLEVVQRFLSAYRNKDQSQFASLLHPDVIWFQPGDNRIAGIKKSKTEWLQMVAKMDKLSDGTLALTDVTYYGVHGNTVVCMLRWTGAQPPGGVLNVNNIDVYTVEDGKIILVKRFSQDIAQENRFWGK